MHTKRWICALSMALCGCMVFSLIGVNNACDTVSNAVVRLHVLAASNSEEDQAIKLSVRDAVLQETQELWDKGDGKEVLLRRLRAALPQMEQAANACLQALGSTDTATAMVCTMTFPEREYETVTLPAGRYEALRIVIGEGEGQNWWCVVFPPMCVTGACDPSWEDVLPTDATELITHPEKYRVRLKIVQWMRAIKSDVLL